MLNTNYMKLLLAAIIISTTAVGQNESFLGLCFGAAIPQGTYADKDFHSEGAGYAETGFIFTFDGTIFPDDYLGIGMTVTYGSNNPDKEQYKEDVITDLIERYPEIIDYQDQIYFDYGTWRYLNFHAGPAFTIPSGPFNFDLKALAGLSLVWAPEQLLQVTWGEENEFSRKVEDKAVPTIGFTIGTGIRYAMKSGYVLRVIAEYTNCKPTMEVTEDYLESIIEGSEVKTVKYQMPIKNIQLGIGIAYNFEI